LASVTDRSWDRKSRNLRVRNSDCLGKLVCETSQPRTQN